MTVAVSVAGMRAANTHAMDDPARSLRYVNGQREQALSRLGLRRVRDVLLHLPHRYLDFSNVTKIGYADVGSDVTVIGVVDRVRARRSLKGMSLVEISVQDETGVLMVTFFRKPWIAKQLNQGDVVALSGKVGFKSGFRSMAAPFMEVLAECNAKAEYARVLPVHPVGEGVSASWMRRIISAAIADVGDVCDSLPAKLVVRRRLMTLSRALREVHFPSSLQAAEHARKRLAYDELLMLQLALHTRRTLELRGSEPHVHVIDGQRKTALVKALPFALTDEQRMCVDEILADMAAPHVMNRLLLGDVGTGKTAVALVAVAVAADSGTQAAVMAPTSVLASQYAEKLGGILDAAGITWALVTGSTPARERAEIAENVSSGSLTCLFGTTALLSDDIAFADLSLVVIDEQHRFGVNQRLSLRKKGAGADLLTMSATPIPRTLALSLYGDVECSRIRHRPNPGAGVTTHVVAPENVDLAYGAIRDAVAEGHQAYVICPLVDERDDGSDLDDVPERAQSNAREVHAATATFERLGRSALRGRRLGLLTGRMSTDEKDDVMSRFRSGEIEVLVATTVVEVGVDVPNATVMLIFDADRFGLATLHQLRGRVGRGFLEGTAYLTCAAAKGTPARDRLAALEATSDGFELAELDLSLRREGDVLGYRQHGVSLKVTDFSSDGDLVEAAHEDAREVLGADPFLESDLHALLARECRSRYAAYFEEMGRS